MAKTLLETTPPKTSSPPDRPRSARRAVEAILPLTSAQQGMLFESVLAGREAAHVEQLVCHVDGDLDVEIFRQAWDHILARHAALRACFVWQNQEQPRQVVVGEATMPIRTEDWRESWSQLGPEEQRERLSTFAAADRRVPFVLNRAPLMRLTLLRTGDRRHHLVWDHHHLLMDGWCQPLLLEELFANYRARAAGTTPLLPTPRPYRDYFRWLESQDEAAVEQAWRKRLAGFVQPTPLGRSGGVRQPPPEEAYAEVERRLSVSSSQALRDNARALRQTPATLVQAAWSLLLGRYSGARDVVFGITVSGRPPELEGIERTVGLFINTLPMRARWDDSTRLGPWLDELKASNLSLHQLEHTPGTVLRRAVDVPLDRPLFESVLVYENYPVSRDLAERREAELTVGGFENHGARTRYALTLLVDPGERLGLSLIVAAERFAAADAERLLEHLESLLAGLAAAGASTPLADLLGRIPETEIPVVHAAPQRRRSGGTPEAPRTTLEERVLSIWQRILRVDSLGVHDDFFELGGHSLLAAELITALRQALGLEIPLRLLFAAPTVAGLARELEPLRDGTEGEPLARPAVVPDSAALGEPFPLTEVQQAYWVGRGSAVELGNVATHSYSEVEATGLDLDRLATVWNRLVERHGMLRAIVLPDGRQQILEDVGDYTVTTYDLHGLPPADVTRRLMEVRKEMSHQVLPADRWPLFDIRASRLGGGRTRLHLSFDLLIGDGWSFRVLARELARLYVDPAAELPALELSFRDCVLAEEALSASALHRRDREYWIRRLDALPPAPALPLARSPREIEKPRFSRRAARLDGETWGALKRRAARAGLTSSGVLLAAFAEVLRTWSKEPGLSINLTLFNRPAIHPQVHEIVGDFTSVTLLGVEGWQLDTFEARARSLQQRLWDDLDHRTVSGVSVLRELARKRGDRGGAVMPVIFTSTLGLDAMEEQRGDRAGLEGEGLPEDLEVVYSIGQTPQVWLDHQVSEQGGILHFLWDAVEELFPEGQLDAMFGAYCGLLERLATEESAWVKDRRGELVPEDQRRRLARINSTTARLVGEDPYGALLHGLFERRAEAQPEASAVITSERRLSYGELHRRAEHLATELVVRGAGRGQLVAVVMEKGWRQAVATLAVLRSGAAYLPIELPLPEERVHQLLHEGEVQWAVTTPAMSTAFDWPEGVEPLAVPEGEPEPLTAAAAAALADVAVRPDDLAYVIFTSGSTGRPKGVMIDHRGAVNTVLDLNQRYGLGPGDRVLGLSSLHFDLSVYDLFGLLAAGGATVLPEPEAWRDPARWAALLDEHRVTLWNTVPALLQMLVEYLEPQGRRLPHLRRAMLSGDWIPVDLPDRFRRLAPAAAVDSLGGATEASIWSILYPIDRVDPGWRSIPYGRPLRNQTMHVLDGNFQPRAFWVPGELYIGGVGVALGYWRDDERTDQSFVLSPTTGERLYRTGDLGRWRPDGNIEFLGREDNQVKVRGHRIELGEIEAVLEAHPDVERAAVVAVGEAVLDRRLVAYAVRATPGMSEAAPGPAGAVGDRFALPATASREEEVPASAGLDRLRLEATLALLAGRDDNASPLPRYLYGSAGSLYPVQTYLWVGAPGFGELAPGGYYYHPRQHALLPLPTPPHAGDLLEGAPATLVLVGRGAANATIYGPWAEEFRVLEAGYMLDLLRRSDLPMTRCSLAGWNGRRLAEALALDIEDRPLAILRLGEAAPPTAAGDEVHEESAVAPIRGLAEGGDGRELPGALDRLDFKLSEPGLRRDLDTTPVALSAVPPITGPLAERRTHRLFERRAIPLETLAATVRRVVDPSYEVLVACPAGGVEGLAAGIYRATAERGALEALRPGAELPAEAHSPGNRDAFRSAALSLFLVGRGLASGGWDLEGALLAAGAGAQRAMTDGAAEGIAFCPIGSVDRELIAPLLGLAEGDVVLHSLVAGRPAVEATVAAGEEEALLAHLAEKLPDYMVPSVLRFLDQLPLTANGKIDRKSLSTLDALPEPAAATRFVAPRNELEKRISGLLAEVLGVERVGIYDNFFDLGGNSVHLVQAHARMREILDRDVSVVELFRHTTVAALVEHLGAAAGSGDDTADASLAEEHSDEERAAARNRLARRRRRARGED